MTTAVVTAPGTKTAPAGASATGWRVHTHEGIKVEAERIELALTDHKGATARTAPAVREAEAEVEKDFLDPLRTLPALVKLRTVEAALARSEKEAATARSEVGARIARLKAAITAGDIPGVTAARKAVEDAEQTVASCQLISTSATEAMASLGEELVAAVRATVGKTWEGMAEDLRDRREDLHSRIADVMTPLLDELLILHAESQAFGRRFQSLREADLARLLSVLGRPE